MPQLPTLFYVHLTRFAKVIQYFHFNWYVCTCIKFPLLLLSNYDSLYQSLLIFHAPTSNTWVLAGYWVHAKWIGKLTLSPIEFLPSLKRVPAKIQHARTTSPITMSFIFPYVPMFGSLAQFFTSHTELFFHYFSSLFLILTYIRDLIAPSTSCHYSSLSTPRIDLGPVAIHWVTSWAVQWTTKLLQLTSTSWVSSLQIDLSISFISFFLYLFIWINLNFPVLIF